MNMRKKKKCVKMVDKKVVKSGKKEIVVPNVSFQNSEIQNIRELSFCGLNYSIHIASSFETDTFEVLIDRAVKLLQQLTE